MVPGTQERRTLEEAELLALVWTTETLVDSSHHGVQEEGPPQAEDHSGLVLHALDLLADGAGGLVWVAQTNQMRT